MRACLHGPVRPVWLQGSSVTTAVAPRACSGDSLLRASTSAWAVPAPRCQPSASIRPPASRMTQPTCGFTPKAGPCAATERACRMADTTAGLSPGDVIRLPSLDHETGSGSLPQMQWPGPATDWSPNLVLPSIRTERLRERCLITVGAGIPPAQPRHLGSRTITAGSDSHRPRSTFLGYQSRSTSQRALYSRRCAFFHRCALLPRTKTKEIRRESRRMSHVGRLSGRNSFVLVEAAGLLAWCPMVGEDWIEHRRGDGERVGWMIPRDDGFVAVDLLGRERSGPVDWLTAEETLDALGIGYLADLYQLTLDDGRELRVRVAEVNPETVTVKKDDFGAVGVPQIYFSVELPASEKLRPMTSAESAVISPDSFS